MLDVDTSGIDQFLLELDAEQRAMTAYVNGEYRRLVEIVFRDILQGTPQWSGNLASNWYVGINSQFENEQQIPEKSLFWNSSTNPTFEPHKAGDLPAIETSLARLDDLQSFSYLDDIYIYNPTEIAPQVEAHTVYIRPVNLLGGEGGVVAMVGYAELKYETFNPL